ncbi:MAG: magnesium chelatase ATPase subunit I [Pseudomonadota bacterium]
MNVYPFSAIVGQVELKRALIMTAVDRTIGGVLALGDRGAGKSTLIRALAALLPKIDIIDGCQFRCAPEPMQAICKTCKARDDARVISEIAPVIDLPLGASEDRIVGALDLERALSAGERRFEPGLLAAAHRGFLYIDEVNLLEDHLVDLLIDVAASGENIVEREGMSVRHAAQFVLVGSGNPEEGELRPQLIDRFGLAVDVRTPTDVKERVEIVKRRDAFEREPAVFLKKWRRKDAAIRKQIEEARSMIDEIETPDALLEEAAGLCIALGTDGLRGELTLMRAARASAALDGDTAVTTDHLRAVAPMALRHRLRKDPLDDSDASIRVARAIEEVLPA